MTDYIQLNLLYISMNMKGQNCFLYKCNNCNNVKQCKDPYIIYGQYFNRLKLIFILEAHYILTWIEISSRFQCIAFFFTEIFYRWA